MICLLIQGTFILKYYLGGDTLFAGEDLLDLSMVTSLIRGKVKPEEKENKCIGFPCIRRVWIQRQGTECLHTLLSSFYCHLAMPIFSCFDGLS
jgi:hypothetical protein